MVEAEVDYNEEDCKMDGVAFGGLKVSLRFNSPSGSITGKLLPSGNPVDKIEVGQKQYEVSMIDSGMAAVFVRGSDFNLRGDEDRALLNQDRQLLDLLEQIRVRCSIQMGIAKDVQEASSKPAVPKICLVSSPISYTDSSKRQIGKGEIDVLCRFVSMSQFHHAIPGTGAIAVASALGLKHNLVNQLMTKSTNSDYVIGHGSGTVTVNSETKENEIKNV